MLGLKYFGVVVCIIIAISETLPIYLIGKGLWTGQVADVNHFTMKLVFHVVFLVVSCFTALILFKSAKKSKDLTD